MASCTPSCVIPACWSTPKFGLGSPGASAGGSAGGLGLGLGGRGLGGGLQGGSMGGLQGGSMGGFQGGSMGGLQGGSMGGLAGGLQVGGGVSSAELGTLAGVIPQCINQIPPAEVVIQPPSFVVTIPGPILSASCDPIAVGGHTPCGAPGSGILGRSLGSSGGLFGGRNHQGGRGNVTVVPC